MFRKGYKQSDEHKEKIRLANLGKKRTPEQTKKISEAHKGQVAWNKGKKKTQPVNKGSFQKGMTPWNKGLPKEQQPAWQGKNCLGSTKEYCPIFFRPWFRPKIRSNYKNQCQLCGITNQLSLKVFGCNLTIHHIDYNKKNCNLDNLIPLCNKCNSKVNFNRSFWQEYFQARA
jgi:hypothetical protein